MESFDVHDFVINLERAISESVKRNFPKAWDEDHITYSIIETLESRFGQSIQIDLASGIDRWHPWRYPPFLAVPPYVGELNVRWAAYKQTGRDERTFGDIAILIAMRFRDGTALFGVGFSEAKKRNRNDCRFSQVRADQTKRILRNAPRSVFLLYDHDPVCFHVVNGWTCGWSTHSVCIPMDLAMATRKKDTSLYKHSQPFALQFLRYLLGMDLDFSTRAVEIARGVHEDIGSPTYLLVIGVGFDTTAPGEDEVPFDRDRYGRLEPGRGHRRE